MNEASSSIIMLILIVVVFYFMLIRPEKKRKKQAQEMRDSLKKGDSITTIGGIVGKVVQVSQDNIVIETSDDRVRMELTKWAVSTVNAQGGAEAPAKKDEKPAEEEEAPAEEEAEPAQAEQPAEETKQEPAEEKADRDPWDEPEKN